MGTLLPDSLLLEAFVQAIYYHHIFSSYTLMFFLNLFTILCIPDWWEPIHLEEVLLFLTFCPLVIVSGWQELLPTLFLLFFLFFKFIVPYLVKQSILINFMLYSAYPYPQCLKIRYAPNLIFLKENMDASIWEYHWKARFLTQLTLLISWIWSPPR